MTDDLLPFASRGYCLMLALLLFARGMDFLSTWVATPNLVLEGNPLAKKMGWKLGAGSMWCCASSSRSGRDRHYHHHRQLAGGGP